ncbi:hypothetical protein O7626_24145 [Micromonospora sp. WMMD1102]|uniref:hypothetical protein n=1 Tax=Micromonospora sp. WMMD1102 TaxID=3016105 RepID=UPI00241594CD|nr:hypothetical protein [Micromonospora sp. WMMD1102]MDG4788983.1 hypothetical protein [Micromonospora sp. WMMD1102]
MENTAVDEFEVEIDQDAVRRARARVLRATALSAWVSLVGAGIIAALTAGLLTTAGPVFLLNAVPALLLGASGAHNLRRRRNLRATWSRQGIAPVAMRLSGAGLRLSIDAAPDSIFLPWSTVQGVRLVRRRGQQLLVLDLAPGVGPGSPGVTGLEHPDVQRVLNSKVLGVKGLRTAVRVLRQPVSAIDQALAARTGGRVRVR